MSAATKPQKALMLRWSGAIGAYYLAVYLLPLSSDSGTIAEMPITWMAVKGAATFGALGLLQGLILRAHVPVKPLVFAALSGAAGGLAMLITMGLYVYVGVSDVPWMVMRGLIGAMTGALLGGLQLIAMPGLLRKPASWPAMAALAWGVGYVLESATFNFAYTELGVDSMVVMTAATGTIASIAIGGISGIAAVKLAFQGAPNDPATRVDEPGQEHHR